MLAQVWNEVEYLAGFLWIEKTGGSVGAFLVLSYCPSPSAPMCMIATTRSTIAARKMPMPYRPYGKRNTNRRQTSNAASGSGGEVPLYGVPPSAVHA